MSELEGITPLSKELLELFKVEINLVNVASKLADLLTLLELDERSLEDDDVPPPSVRRHVRGEEGNVTAVRKA